MKLQKNGRSGSGLVSKRKGNEFDPFWGLIFVLVNNELHKFRLLEPMGLSSTGVFWGSTEVCDYPIQPSIEKDSRLRLPLHSDTPVSTFLAGLNHPPKSTKKIEIKDYY